MQNPRRQPTSQRRYLSPEQEQQVRQLWAAGASRDEVARAAGVSTDMLIARLKDQLADLPRRGRGGNRRGASPDPTPDEILEATAELRKRWTPDRWLPPPREEIEAVGLDPFKYRRR